MVSNNDEVSEFIPRVPGATGIDRCFIQSFIEHVNCTHLTPQRSSKQRKLAAATGTHVTKVNIMHQPMAEQSGGSSSPLHDVKVNKACDTTGIVHNGYSELVNNVHSRYDFDIMINNIHVHPNCYSKSVINAHSRTNLNTMTNNIHVHEREQITHTAITSLLKVPTWKWPIQEDVDIARRVISSGVINAIGERIPLKLNWNLQLFWSLCSSRLDCKVFYYLLYGWPINRSPGALYQCQDNHPSANKYPEQVEQYIKKELLHGSMMGPFVTSPFPQEITSISPMSTRRKKGGDSRRIIVDLSWPPWGDSVNSKIPKDEYMGNCMKIKYPTIDMLCKRAVQLGLGVAYGWKKDMSRAFRQLLQCPSSWPALAVRWNNAIYFNKSAVMGGDVRLRISVNVLLVRLDMMNML